MIVTSSAIQNGYFNDKYGKRGTEIIKKIPLVSFPFTISEAPEGTKSFAWLLEDEDAIPVAGYSWIHWMAVNNTCPDVPEDYSREATDIVQGINSWNKIGYGGMTPPDQPHIYELHVYALDKLLDLRRGFLLNELYREMDGHILAEYTLKGIYEN